MLRSQSRATTILVNLAAFVIAIAGMKAASPIVVQILLAAFIAIITSPLFFFLTKRGVRPAFALLILIGLLILAGGFVGGVISNSVKSFNDNLPEYQNSVQEHFGQFLSWLKHRGVQIPDSAVKDFFDTRIVFRFARTTFGAVSNMLGQGLVILLIAIFFLLEAAMLPRKVQAAAGMSGKSWDHLALAVDSVRQYMNMKTFICILTGVLVWLMALAFRLDYPIFLGVLAFALNYIPTVGSFMAAIPGVILGLVQFGPWWALAIAGGYTVINVAIGNVLEPRVMGKGLGLSPAIVLISLVFWGWVLGPIGMLLSLPLTMTIKIALESLDETRGIALLLSSSVPEEPTPPPPSSPPPDAP